MNGNHLTGEGRQAAATREGGGDATLPGTLAACGLSALLLAAAPALADAGIPAALVPPGLVVQFTLHAAGVQVYRCTVNLADAGKTAWTLVGPDAELFEDEALTRPAGRHYAGPNWEASDGSRVSGKLHASAPAPEAQDIPWLWLDATSIGGPGRFAGITAIQRVETRGGKAPPGPCDPAAEPLRVHYAAQYRFLAPAP